jgi:5-methyltetrahydrofolate--homocysteine methyltransferase
VSDRFHQRLSTGPPLLADGAMGTMLQQVGLPPGTPSAPWTLTHPGLVAAVHAAYVAVGCELLLTNTLNTEAAALNEAAVRLARQSGARWVAGSLGPGAGASQVDALLRAGVDLLWLETQLSLEESLRSVALCQAASDLPRVVTFSFHREDGLTHAGEHAAEVARALEAAGASVVGLNCGAGLRGIAARLAEMSSACALPLALKPNAGLPALDERQWASALVALLTPRVRLLGGCCGSTPAALAMLKQQTIAKFHDS